MAQVREVAARRSTLEAELLTSARELAAEVGSALLADKGFSDVEELSAGQRRRWRAETKRLACAELQIALGVGIKEARQLVGVACAPVSVRTVVHEALRSGLAGWGHVRGFWDRCGSLPAESGALVAEALFGSDAATVVPERLGPDGQLLDRPWHAAEFWAALEREAVRVEGQDVQSERERRRKARAERRLWMRIDDDSTATLAITGPLTSLCAISQRVDACARALRKGGDERTLAQLRSDVAQTLLLHGRVDPPESDTDPLLTPGGAEHIAQVVTAQPHISLQVVVPWTTFSSPSTSRSADAAEGPPGKHGGGPPVPPDRPRPERSGDDARHGDPDREHGEAPPASPYRSGPERSGDDPPRDLHGDPPLSPPDRLGPDRSGDPRSRPVGAVGEIVGRHSAFITPGHARELALTPGAVLSRLLTDPADGRLIERSITSYRPDAAMRRQIIAADVYSRAPGNRRPAAACEIDHETPWGDGGATTETNLSLKDVASHQLKTAGWWSTTMAPNRDLTWQTLLGQIERTRSHDYRQYLPTIRAQADAAGTGGEAVAGHTGGDESDTVCGGHEDDLDLACRALYTALAHRGTAALLADDDDADGATDHDPRLTGWITLTHRGRDGQRRHGPREDLATLPNLLGFATPPDPATDSTSKTESTSTTDSTSKTDSVSKSKDSDLRRPWGDQPDAPPPF
ncbi:HNH endonuclease signature motif containing protein [Serinicoccus kebangsaanensis]|uniref:HNH endonuclease signature motif containing protein n=1 Tax=Serinicoccus kebangsaanensis TaxID=2602069 RepID=UPI00192DB962|nr:HNH endonuclease signature motif containing protein [Serinicoccus kebangsaanensis]